MKKLIVLLGIIAIPTFAVAGSKKIKTIDMGRLTVCEAEKIIMADQCDKQINGMKSTENQVIGKLRGLKNKEVDAILDQFTSKEKVKK